MHPAQSCHPTNVRHAEMDLRLLARIRRPQREWGGGRPPRQSNCDAPTPRASWTESSAGTGATKMRTDVCSGGPTSNAGGHTSNASTREGIQACMHGTAQHCTHTHILHSRRSVNTTEEQVVVCACIHADKEHYTHCVAQALWPLSQNSADQRAGEERGQWSGRQAGGQWWSGWRRWC